MGAAPSTPSAKVTGLFIYPVKSCRGISVVKAPLTPAGFRWDRQWMLVSSINRRAFTQRHEPKLALVEVELPPQAFDEAWEPTTDSYMVLKAPGMPNLKICLNKQHEVTDAVSVWQWTGSAWDEGAEASQWFSDFLGKPCQLVRFNTTSEIREVDRDYVGADHKTLFSDGFPYLVVSQESLDALNEVLKEPITINRFRPSIVVEGCLPFSEDLWTDFKIGRFSFRGVKLCARCKIPTVNPEVGIYGREPTVILNKTRSGKLIRPSHSNKSKVYFGQNVVWNWKDSSAKRSGKFLEVGDLVYVLRKVSSADEAAA